MNQQTEFRRIGKGCLSVVLLTVFGLSLAGCMGGAGLPSNPNVGGGPPGVDFSMTATPGSETLAAGTSGSFTLTLNPPAVVGAVNFSVTGVPTGIQAAFSPDSSSTAGVKTLNIFSSTNTPSGTFPLTITGSDSTGSRSTTVSLTITASADFSLSVSPQSQQVKPGGTATYTVTVGLSPNALVPVNLSAVGAPQGATVSFSQNSVSSAGTVILTVTAGPQIVSVVAPMDVVGTDGSGTIQASFGFSIIPADFFLDQNVGPVIVDAGGTVTGQIQVAPLFASPGTVMLTASSLPQGVTASFNPNPVIGVGTSIMTIANDGSTPAGDYTLTVNGVDASGTNFVTVPYSVALANPGAGFFLAASPVMEEINAGDEASFAINVTVPSGPIPPLTFSASANQSGLDLQVLPIGNGPGTYILTAASPPSIQQTTEFQITVSATGPNGTQFINVIVLVDAVVPTGN